MTGELFVDIVQAVVGLCAILISGFLVPYLKAKVQEKKLQHAQIIVDSAVHAAEQLFNAGGQGDAKKKYVVDYLNKQNIQVTDEQLDVLIEAAVQKLHEIKTELFVK